MSLEYDKRAKDYTPIILYNVPKKPTVIPIAESIKIFHDLHNKVRKQAFVQRLSRSAELSFLAQQHTYSMSHNNTLEHTKNLGERAIDIDYNWKTIGENVAYHTWTGNAYITARQLFRGLMNSPGHRKNILNPLYENVGYGFAIGNDGLAYCTMIFGKRQ